MMIGRDSPVKVEGYCGFADPLYDMDSLRKPGHHNTTARQMIRQVLYEKE